MAKQLQGETELLQQALQATTAIQNENNRAKVLEAVAGQLQGNSELQKSCFEIALNLTNEQWRITITAELTRQNTDLLTYELWTDWLKHANRQKRAELLEVMGDLTQAAVQFTGNPKEADEIARAIIDVGRWWP